MASLARAAKAIWAKFYISWHCNGYRRRLEGGTVWAGSCLSPLSSLSSLSPLPLSSTATATAADFGWMLTTTVGLNNNTCRNIIFMLRVGSRWGQIVFMTRTRRWLAELRGAMRRRSYVLLLTPETPSVWEIKNWFYSVKHAIMRDRKRECWWGDGVKGCWAT